MLGSLFDKAPSSSIRIETRSQRNNEGLFNQEGERGNNENNNNEKKNIVYVILNNLVVGESEYPIPF